MVGIWHAMRASEEEKRDYRTVQITKENGRGKN
jgi:hypothetical protein